jgi:uncharacterized protein (DUF2336 family)
MAYMQLEPTVAAGPIERMFAGMPLKTRVKTAHTVAHDYATTAMSPEDLSLAESIIMYLAQDIDPKVRSTISEEVKECLYLAREIALQLAWDIDPVSLPVISCSRILTEEDLLEILEAANEAKQIAIARRTDIDVSVTHKIAVDCCYEAVEACLENKTAVIDHTGYHHVLLRYGKEETIQELMIHRPLLPGETIDRLRHFLPKEHQQTLNEEHDQPDNLTTRMILNARERVLTKSLNRRMTDYEQKKASVALEREGRLTATLMLRMLISDNQSFFTAALAQGSGISKKRVAALVSGRGYLGFRRLYERAQMPQYLYVAFRAVLEEIRKAAHYHPRADKENFKQRIIDRVAHEFDFEDDLSLEELMEKLLPKGTH